MVLSPYQMDEYYYSRIGQTLRDFHLKTQKLANEYDLPNYDFITILENSWSNIAEASFMTKQMLHDIHYYKELVKAELSDELNKSLFVHFNFHRENVIFNHEQVFMIDWDESGLVHHKLDLW